MNDISCDICLDLMPLVIDGVAADDSVAAVKKHIESCEQCRQIYKNSISHTENQEIIKGEMNDKKIIKNIRKKVIFVLFCLIAACIAFGIAIAIGENMFYNVILMPVIGALSYAALRKKSYFTLIFIFVSIYIRFLIEEYRWCDGSDLGQYLLSGVWWSVIYTSLCAVGILIAFLISFGLRKDEKK